MAEPYAWYITSLGWQLMEKLVAGETGPFEISRCMIGCGEITTQDPVGLLDLIEPLCSATSTVPYTDGESIFMTVEYRNDLNGGQVDDYSGDQAIRELGIYAVDPDEGEILMYYGYLGDYPEEVPALGSFVITRRWGIQMSFTTEADITILYDASSYMTAEDVYNYVMGDLNTYVLSNAAELIEEHNADPEAHPAIRSQIVTVQNNLEAFQQALIKNVSGSTYTVLFDDDDIDTLTVTGTWNESYERIEF